MYISSLGDDVAAGFGIYDTMQQQMHSPIATIAVGATHSFGTILLTAGTPSHRYALENATIHMPQPLIGGGGLSGQATDIHIHTQQLLRTQTRIEKIMSKHTGQSVEQLRNDMERDHYFDANEAQEYGLVDHVLGKRDDKMTDRMIVQ